jgi:hypothetical protein
MAEDGQLHNEGSLMTTASRLPGFSKRTATDAFNRAVGRKRRHWVIEARTILLRCCEQPILFPQNIKAHHFGQYVTKWVAKFENGYLNRASHRLGQPPATKPDQIVGLILRLRVSSVTKSRAKQLLSGHRLCMAIENWTGDILEEYIAQVLSPHGWCCAWGDTMRDIDFLSPTGVLLQVKNRSNSESSAASRVRKGTAIKKWHRSNARTGGTEWGSLREIVGLRVRLSEESFTAFVTSALKGNRRAIHAQRGTL